MSDLSSFIKNVIRGQWFNPVILHVFSHLCPVVVGMIEHMKEDIPDTIREFCAFTVAVDNLRLKIIIL